MRRSALFVFALNALASNGCRVETRPTTAHEIREERHEERRELRRERHEEHEHKHEHEAEDHD
jgi:hypothetical protein